MTHAETSTALGKKYEVVMELEQSYEGEVLRRDRLAAEHVAVRPINQNARHDEQAH